MIYCDYAGAGSAIGLANIHPAAVLMLPQTPSLQGQSITLELSQGGPQFKKNLGRFRLATTTAHPPYEMEPPVYLLPPVEHK
jgi:hypothetical protein